MPGPPMRGGNLAKHICDGKPIDFESPHFRSYTPPPDQGCEPEWYAFGDMMEQKEQEKVK